MNRHEQTIEPHRLSRKEKMGFGVGDLGFGIFWTSTNLYLLYYYTDVLGLSGRVAGLIFMGAMLWDAISDPLIGLIVSRFRTRWGQYRPYLLFGAIPLSLSFAMMFFRPSIGIGEIIAYTVITHVLFRTFYTLMAVPYGALMAEMTNDSVERSSLTVHRLAFTALGGIFVAFSTLKLTAYFGNGDETYGFTVVGALYAAIAIPVFLLTFALVKERNTKTWTAGQPRPRLSARKMLSSTASNTPFWLIFSATALSVFSSTFSDKLSIYYLIYALDAKPVLGEIIAVGGIVTACSFPLWSYLATRHSKRIVWLAGLGISIATSLLILILPISTAGEIFPLLIIGAVGKGALYFSFWATLPDSVEYGEWKTGIRSSALLFGLVTFSQKAAMGAAMGALGIFLDWIGYSANELQTADTLVAMKYLMTLIPATALIVVAILIWYYPVDQKLHSRLIKATKYLEKKREQSVRLKQS